MKTTRMTSILWALILALFPISIACGQVNEIIVTNEGVQAGNSFDNANALIAIRDSLLDADGVCNDPVRLVFPPAGDQPYKYSNNRWLMGLTNVHILGSDGNGNRARLQNNINLRTGVGTDKEKKHFTINDSVSFAYHVGNPWTTRGDEEIFGKGMSFTTGQRIDTAMNGTQVVKLQNPDDIALYGYEEGGFVMIHSFNQQGYNTKLKTATGLGFPPNPRYFEYRTITSIDHAEGVLTLDEKLAYNHLENYPDFMYDDTPPTNSLQERDGTVMLGKPRMLNLTGRPLELLHPQDPAEPPAMEKKLHFPSYVKIEGVELLPNLHNLDKENILAVPAMRLVVKDVKVHGSFWPTQAREVWVNDSETLGYVELDKCCEEVVMRDCEIGLNTRNGQSIFAGTGVNDVRLVNVHCEGVMAVTAQENLTIIGGSASSAAKPNNPTNAPIELFGGTYGGKKAYITGVSLTKNESNDDGSIQSHQADLLMGFADKKYRQYVVEEVNGSAIVFQRKYGIQEIDLGSTGLGIAVHTAAEGVGYIMYSDEKVGPRFGGILPTNAEHLIAVQWDEDESQWMYSNNSNWKVFEPRPDSDRLLAKVNFSSDFVAGTDPPEDEEEDLEMWNFDSSFANNGLERLNGILKGYTANPHDPVELEITHNLWAGSYKEGEFRAIGSSILVKVEHGAVVANPVLPGTEVFPEPLKSLRPTKPDPNQSPVTNQPGWEILTGPDEENLTLLGNVASIVEGANNTIEVHLNLLNGPSSMPEAGETIWYSHFQDVRFNGKPFVTRKGGLSP